MKTLIIFFILTSITATAQERVTSYPRFAELKYCGKMFPEIKAQLDSDPQSALELAAEKRIEATSVIKYYTATLNKVPYLEQDQRDVSDLRSRVKEVAELELCSKQATEKIERNTSLIDWRLFGN